MPGEHLIETVRGAIEWAAIGIELRLRPQRGKGQSAA